METPELLNQLTLLGSNAIDVQLSRIRAKLPSAGIRIPLATIESIVYCPTTYTISTSAAGL